MSVSAGGRHACALVSDGTIRCWADRPHDALGPPKHNSNGEPVLDAASGVWVADHEPPNAYGGWLSVSAGYRHTCASAYAQDPRHRPRRSHHQPRLRAL